MQSAGIRTIVIVEIIKARLNPSVDKLACMKKQIEDVTGKSYTEYEFISLSQNEKSIAVHCSSLFSRMKLAL
jgi:hypothetical protein